MAGGSEGNDLWVRRYNPAPDPAVRLACMPHAGGSASYFVSTSRLLAPQCEVLAVQYPGRQDRRRERPFENVTDLADAVAQQLLVWTDRPMALFGHSLGAVVAFEVAYRLAAQGCTPLALIVSGRRAPSRYRAENVHTRDDEGLLREVRSLGGTDPLALAEPEMREMILAALRADYTAVETYRCPDRNPLQIPIYGHFGLDDPQVTIEEAQSWAAHTTSHFELHTYPGGHFYLNTQATALTANIRGVLASETVPTNHPTISRTR
ncbi:thioesterase II family protein [Nocardia nepalensis]|uniref:thioesterase II family protein n=1 Tax=Nocardia nepalensis TaxID=3375448 RepID=UPI003B677F7F